MRPRTKRAVIASAAIALLVPLAPLPLPITLRDKEAAASHAINALLRDRRVLTNTGYCHLEEISFVKGKQLYFVNDLGIRDALFLRRGLMPAPKEKRLRTGDGVAAVAFSNRDIEGKQTEQIQFAYVFGPLGAHGYQIRIYKSLVTRYFLYAHQWIS